MEWRHVVVKGDTCAIGRLLMCLCLRMQWMAAARRHNPTANSFLLDFREAR